MDLTIIYVQLKISFERFMNRHISNQLKHFKDTDHLSEPTRNIKRNLLFISFVIIAINMDAVEQGNFLVRFQFNNIWTHIMILIVEIYFIIEFASYFLSDLDKLSCDTQTIHLDNTKQLLNTIKSKVENIDKKSAEITKGLTPKIESSIIESDISKLNTSIQQMLQYEKKLIKLRRKVFFQRWVIDFIIPLIVSGIAIATIMREIFF